MKKTIGLLSLFSLLILAGCSAKNVPATTTTTPVNTTVPSVVSVTPPAPTAPVGITKADVAAHNTKGDCRMIIGSKVYNVTSYFGQHPGGDAKLAQSCGTNGTLLFKTQPPHSSNASNMLKNYYVADVAK